MSSQHYQDNAHSSTPLSDNARPRRSPGPSVQTQNLRQNPRFSWQQTPVQPQPERFEREVFSSPTTTIAESPMSAHPTSETIPMMLYPEEKPALVAPQQVHPAHFAPYVEPTAQQDPHQRQQSPYQRQQSPYQQPQQTPYQQQAVQQTPHQQRATQQPHHYQQHNQYQQHPQPQQHVPYQQQPQLRQSQPQYPSSEYKPQETNKNLPSTPHDTRPLTTFPAPPAPPSPDFKKPTTPRTPTYNPHSPFGPNASTHAVNPTPTSHMPGQIPHPNATSTPTWSSSFMTPDTTCLHGCFSPCTLYSLTTFRLSQKSSHKDPTNLLSHSTCDSNAWIYALSCGLCGILACIQRGRVRRGYNIEGGVGGDCITGVCCSCCALAQSEKEIKTREEDRRRNEGPSIGYQAVDGMRYEPPPKVGR